MKKHLTFPLLLIVLTSITIGACSGFLGNSEESNSTDWEQETGIIPGNEQQLSEEQQQAYHLDAERLAVRFINNTDSTRTTIPDKLITNLYNGFVHVATSDHEKAQQATGEYQIHTRRPHDPRSILVFADTTASWIEAWRNGQTQTGNSEIDQLINQFNFELTDYAEFEQTAPTGRATLQSDSAINGYAVGRLFEELEDIENAGPDAVTDGNEVNVLFFNNYLRYFFELRYGDCPSGCINSHVWIFNVNRNGTVEFLDEDGDPLSNFPG